MKSVTIGIAARTAGVGVETVRFYERQGLIAQPPKPSGSGPRRYPPETVERIRFTRQAQELGFSLREIKDLLDLRGDPGTDCAAVRALAAAKLDNVHNKILQLQHIAEALERVIAACPGGGGLEACSIMDAITPHSSTSSGDPPELAKAI